MCALAYSSAITMCSGRVYDHTADWTSFISPAMALITLALVLWNYKGYRTILSAAIIILGGSIIFYSEIFSGDLVNYYWGCAIVVAGVWANGSLMHFARKWFGVDSRMRRSLANE